MTIKTSRKKLGNARAFGSQRRAAGVPQAIRTVLHFSAFAASLQFPAACWRNAVRYVALRRAT